MDVVEFVEQVFGLHLMDYQKEFLIKVYEATRDDRSVMYIPGRCYCRSSFKLLEASAIIFDAQTKGLLKPVSNERIRGVGVMVANLLGAMAIFNKISSDTGKVSKACTAMIAMSVAVSILAGALKKVSDLDWGELARGLVGIAGLTTIVVASSKAMASGQKQVMKGATKSRLLIWKKQISFGKSSGLPGFWHRLRRFSLHI